MVDILIPLGNESKNNNDELKLALRSIDKYTDVDRVFIMTTADIPWLTNVNIVKLSDPYKHNKDKNLIYKVIECLKQNPDIDDFVFWSDDQVITAPINLCDIPKVYNNRGLKYFKDLVTKTKWQKRVIDTLSILNFVNYDVSCNWEAHVPALYNSQKILKKIKNIDWASDAGNYTICTLFSYLCDYKKQDGVNQDIVKYTYENKNPDVKFDKLFIGYNDTGFNNGVKEALFNAFNTPSIYEREFNVTSNTLDTLCVFAKNINKNNIDKFCNLLNYDQTTVIFALDKGSYDIINSRCLKVYTAPCTDVVTFNAFKSAVNIVKYMTKYCVVIDGKYDYPANYIKNNIHNLDNNVSLCIINALQSFDTMLFDTNVIAKCIEKVEKVDTIENLGAFLIDLGVRPAVIVNNAT